MALERNPQERQSIRKWKIKSVFMGRNKKDFKTKKTHMSIRIDFDEEAIKEMSMAKEWYNGQAIGL